MALKDILIEEVEEKLNTSWDERDGNVVPESEDVALKNGAVKIDATFLYADLAGSSKLAQICPWQTTAKIIRAYLGCCTRCIRAHGGEIRSFDGDRVMGIFKTKRKNNDAVECARQIDWVVHNIINQKAKDKFKSIKENDIRIKHCIGIDTGIARAVRAGIRDNNDLIWIGRAPSLAAKLSDVRNYPYEVYITKDCYDRLDDKNKVRSDGGDIWETDSFTFAGESKTVYKTKIPTSP